MEETERLTQVGLGVMKTDHQASNLSDEEIEALQACNTEADVPLCVLNVDRWFKYRNAFLFLVVVFYAIRLLGFTESVVSNLVVHADERENLLFYLKFRAIFVIVLASIYSWSYLKQWRFEKIALITAIISITSLVMDYFNAYVYMHEKATVLFICVLCVRLLTTACLIVNAMNAHRVPIK